jgi:recombination protein RecR
MAQHQPLQARGFDGVMLALVRRVRAHDPAIHEVVIATNPSLEGEATALYVQGQLCVQGVTISRIARGLPVGGDLEYADGVTIAQAMNARRTM